MTRLTDIIAIVTVFLTPSVVRAQAPELALAPGARVRVTAPGALTPARQSGRVLAASRDSLRVQLDGSTDSLWLARALLTELEIIQPCGHVRITHYVMQAPRIIPGSRVFSRDP